MPSKFEISCRSICKPETVYIQPPLPYEMSVELQKETGIHAHPGIQQTELILWPNNEKGLNAHQLMISAAKIIGKNGDQAIIISEQFSAQPS